MFLLLELFALKVTADKGLAEPYHRHSAQATYDKDVQSNTITLFIFYNLWFLY